MKTLLGLLVAAGVSAIALAQPAAASNLEVLKQQEASPLIMVADGCGRGWFRDRWGVCHRDRPAYYYGRPVYYGGPYFYARPFYWHRPHYWHHGW